MLLLMPWDGQTMAGVIDLIYELNGLLYLADYKTDRIAREELTQGAEPYRQQAQVYLLGPPRVFKEKSRRLS